MTVAEKARAKNIHDESTLDNDLPDGWASPKIGEVFQINYGKGLKESIRKSGAISVYGSNGIVGTHNVSLTRGPTIVIGRKGTVGAIHLSPHKCWPIDTTYYIDTFFDLDVRFVFNALRGIGLSELDMSSAIPGINRDEIYSLTIPLPPLAEQKRIVAKVEKLLEKVNAARERLAKIPAILKRFRQSVLASACSGKLTEDWRESHPQTRDVPKSLEDLKANANGIKIRRGVPESVPIPEDIETIQLPSTWACVSVAELLRSTALVDVKDGNHGSNHPKVSDFTVDGRPFITAAQVKNYQIDYDDAYKIKGNPLKHLRVGFSKVGDAILTHKGSVGRAAINTQDCVLTPQTTYYRTNPKFFDAKYIVYFFTSPQFFGQLSQVMSQTTRDFVPISEQYSLFIIVPPIDEQREIVRRVEALFKLATGIEKRVGGAMRRADRLTRSILAKAFRSDLVPVEAALARCEGRDYEPASVLLERIQAERLRSQEVKENPAWTRKSRRKKQHA